MKRRVWVELDVAALAENYRRIRERIAPLELMCVLKANAYQLGSGLYARALYAAGCRKFAVAEPYEALELKEIFAGVEDVELQVLSSILPDEIEEMVAAGVTLPVAEMAAAEAIDAAAAKLGVKAKVHFKIDTGMGRLGILPHEAPQVIARAKALGSLELEGIFSHCPLAYDPDDGFTARQIAFFADMVEDLRAKGFRFKCVHIAASDAINNFPEAFRAPFTMARSGINLHGSFDPNGIKALKLKPVLSLKTRVAQVRRLPAGTTLGYGRTWKLDSERDIATISAGYADGLPMALANRGKVFIGGKRCPIVGRVSMDYATVDVTGAGAVKCGDEVVCFGAAGEDAITPDDWAAIKGTHAYDILCSLGTRVARTVLGDT
jgi:alanine racemase